MSEAFSATVAALGSDAALRERVLSASSAEERSSILREAGISVPSHADVNSGALALADVVGAGTDTPAHDDPLGAVAAAAAGSSAAA